MSNEKNNGLIYVQNNKQITIDDLQQQMTTIELQAADLGQAHTDQDGLNMIEHPNLPLNLDCGVHGVTVLQCIKLVEMGLSRQIDTNIKTTNKALILVFTFHYSHHIVYSEIISVFLILQKMQQSYDPKNLNILNFFI